MKAAFRRITVEDGSSDRREWIGELGADTEITGKTTLGAGIELGDVNFDHAESGSEFYVEPYLSAVWRASPMTVVSLKAGIERRTFDRPIPENAGISPVILASVLWKPDELTRMNAGLRVRNQPSVVHHGTLFQEIRFGALGSTERYGTW